MIELLTLNFVPNPTFLLMPWCIWFLVITFLQTLLRHPYQKLENKRLLQDYLHQ